MKWCAALLPLLVVGCSRKQSTPPVRPQPVVAPAQAQVPEQDSVAYVQQSADGTKRAAIWWAGENREQVLVEGVQGEVRMQPLPNGWPWWNEYALHGRPALEHPGKPCPLYIDTYTGLHVTPGPALGLDDGHSVLLDLVGDRAVVIRQTDTPDLHEPSAMLVLYQGATAEELGRVYLTPPMMSYHRRYFALSPDRSRLAWSGPEGSFLADLATGEVQKRPREYSWDGSSTNEPEMRDFRWLPDGSGFIEYRWIDGDPHWERFSPDGQGPVATGRGLLPELTQLSRAELPEYSLLAQAEKGDDGWRVRVVNSATGDAEVVLTCQAHEVHVWRAGEEHFIAIAEQDAQHRLTDLYVGGADTRPWKLVAEDVCEPVIMPSLRRPPPR